MRKKISRKMVCWCLAAGVLLSLPRGAAAAEAPVHILLIGHDRRPGEQGSRADCMILCSYLPEKDCLTMTSFLRDLYVPVPGYGSDRLNAAYAYGGRKLLKKTLEQNFGVRIDGCAEVDFGQFSRVVDALGGVTLSLREDEAAHINRSCGASLQAGEQLLDGTQALCYTRIRSLDPDGDFSRTRRQQAVLQALLKKWRTAKPAALMKTAMKLLPMISTDLDPARILHWAVTLAPAAPGMQLESLRIPAPGCFSEETVRNMAVLVPDLEANRAVLKTALNSGNG